MSVRDSVIATLRAWRPPDFAQDTLREAVLAFVDREPLANWGHSSRYLLMRRGADEEMSVEARLPPFGSDVQLSWRVVYKAPGMPDTALGAAKS